MIDKKTDRYDTLQRMVSREMFDHNVATPELLVDRMIETVTPNLFEDAQILVLFNMEFVVSLTEDFPYTLGNITLFTNGDLNLEKVAQKIGINTIESLDTNMKFDICLANPPFSEGAKLLYPKFFALALDMCDEVVFVMPVSLDSQAPKLKSTNYLIKRHSSNISDSVSDNHFKSVGVPNICMVTASKSVTNYVEEEVDVLESLPLKHPKRARLSIRTGTLSFDSRFESEAGMVTVVDKVLRSGVTYKKVPQSFYAKSKSRFSSGIGVIIGRQPSSGIANTAIVTDKTTKWASNVIGIECSSKKEAKRLKEWLDSDVIRKEIITMLEAKNTFSVSKAMMERLPHYE